MAFQRTTNRLVHAASGEILGLFVYVFNRLFDIFMSCTSFSYVLLRLREDKGFNASAPLHRTTRLKSAAITT